MLRRWLRSWSWRLGGGGVLPRAPMQPLPAGLHERLRGIAQEDSAADGLCAELHRSWAGLARGELRGERQEVMRRHLQSCSSCSAVFATLWEAVEPPVLLVPTALRQRLTGIFRRQPPPLPRSLLDARYALLASYLLTLGLWLTVGDPYRWLTQEVGALKEPVVATWTEVETQGRGLLVDLSAEARSEVDRGQLAVLKYRDELQRRWQELQDKAQIPGMDEDPPEDPYETQKTDRQQGDRS